jgi:septum formation protein
MAQTKARSVFEPDLALPTLSADTAVTLDGAVFGKPGDRGEAKKMLTALSGKTHKVITGYCVHMGDNKPEICGSVETGITFRALTAQEIDGYLDRGESMDKAGAYAIQLGAGFMTADVDGSFTNIVGLPLKEVIDSLFSALGGDPRRQGGRMNPF